MSTSKDFMDLPIKTTAIRMIIKNLLEAMFLQKRIKFITGSLFGQRLNGLECIQLGKQAYFSYIPINNMSSRNIILWLWNYFGRLLTMPLWLYNLILKLEIAMLGLHSIWMTGISYIFLFLLNSSSRHLVVNMIWIVHQILRNKLQFLARIGVWASVLIPVQIIGNTEYVQSVEESTKQRMSSDAILACKIGDKHRGQVIQQVEVAPVVEEPRQFQSLTKRKFKDLSCGPQFCRRYVWTNSFDSTSPAALNTKTAEPFQSPPTHLLGDPSI
jgi:hypothetical protein